MGTRVESEGIDHKERVSRIPAGALRQMSDEGDSNVADLSISTVS